MRSQREVFERIGTQGLLKVKQLRFPVTIQDARVEWGKARFLVTPVSVGSGEQWVDEESLFLLDKG